MLVGCMMLDIGQVAYHCNGHNLASEESFKCRSLYGTGFPDSL